MCVKILLLANLTKKNTDLVGEVGHGIIAGLLTPLGELRCDGDALLAGSLVRTDEVILGLNESEETASEVWLGCTTEGREGESATSALVAIVSPVAVGADRKRAIPIRKLALDLGV